MLDIYGSLNEMPPFQKG